MEATIVLGAMSGLGALVEKGFGQDLARAYAGSLLPILLRLGYHVAPGGEDIARLSEVRS